MAILQLMEKHPTPLKGVRKCLTLPEIKVPPFPNPPEWCRIFSPQKVRWELSPQQKTQEILENTSSFLLRMAGEIQENQNLQRMSKGELQSPHHCKVVDKTKVGIQGSARPQISSVGVEMWVPRFNQGNRLLGMDAFWESTFGNRQFLFGDF